MVELLFLLLPIAAAYGWYMGRRSAGHQHQRDVSEHSKNYFAGLNYLLSDEPDKAVDQFIALVEVDSETIETHLALGRLFRQRGEVDRSLRIHQNLLARPSLTEEQRDKLLRNIPTGRLGQVNDVGASVVFLASDEASYVTGQTIHVNGGMTMI